MDEKFYKAITNELFVKGNRSYLDILMNLNYWDAAPVIVPPEVANGISIPWDANSWQSTLKQPESNSLSLQKRGELLALFPADVQKQAGQMIAFWAGGPKVGDGHTFSVLIDHIPEQFALHPLTLNFEYWIYPPGK